MQVGLRPVASGRACAQGQSRQLFAAGKAAFYEPVASCNQREDYQLAVGSLCPGFTASAAKPSDSV